MLLFEMYYVCIDNYKNLKSLDPIHRKILVHGGNNRFDSFMYTNNQYSSFSNHTHIKLIKISKTKNMSTVNRKYWVTPCFVSHGFGLRTFIVEQNDSVNNKASELFFSCQLTMFAGIILKTFWYLFKLTVKMKTVSKWQYQTKWGVYFSIACK